MGLDQYDLRGGGGGGGGEGGGNQLAIDKGRSQINDYLRIVCSSLRTNIHLFHKALVNVPQNIIACKRSLVPQTFRAMFSKTTYGPFSNIRICKLPICGNI